MVFFFPGQGSQAIGMGQNLYEKYDIAKKIFNEANDILGFDLKKLCFEGPEIDLTNTKNAQPAILTYQYILLRLLKEKGITPTATAGHSLGEFSAILASEMLTFGDTLKLVQKRGELMANADPTQKGGMAAILGLDDETVLSICKKVSQTHYVEPVNFNTPGQVVISGLKEGIALASEKLLAAGAKRALPLPVSGAFHSKLMEEASDSFKDVVTTLKFSSPTCPIISNVTAAAYDENSVKELLPLQMKSPVQWVKIVEYLVSKGYNEGVEVNSGAVIQGMVKKITSDFSMVKIDTLIDL